MSSAFFAKGTEGSARPGRDSGAVTIGSGATGGEVTAFTLAARQPIIDIRFLRGDDHTSLLKMEVQRHSTPRIQSVIIKDTLARTVRSEEEQSVKIHPRGEAVAQTKADGLIEVVPPPSIIKV